MISDHKQMNDDLKVMDEILSESEKEAIGMAPSTPSRDPLMEAVEGVCARIDETNVNMFGSTELVPIGSQRSGDAKTLKPYQGKESDAELMFNFENWDDAQSLYDFIIEAALLEPGEVNMRHIEGQYSVHFQPHVMIMKPDVIMAAMLAYEDILSVDSQDAFESLAEELVSIIDEQAEVLTEAPKNFPGISGAKPGGKGIGNPFHNFKTGKFASRKELAKDKKGSWAHGKVKLKLSGVKKNKEGREVLHFAGTKHPCGRDGRPVPPEKGTLCWAGKVPKWAAALKKAFGKKKRRESFDIEDRASLMEYQFHASSVIALIIED